MIKLSKVYKREDNYAFMLYVEDEHKGYEFDSKSGAKRGRALMLKKLKLEGHTVYC